MNVHLTPELKQLIEDRVASGRYSSASEVVRAALRLLEDDERTMATKIATGLAQARDGQLLDGDEVRDRLRDRINRRRNENQ